MIWHNKIKDVTNFSLQKSSNIYTLKVNEVEIVSMLFPTEKEAITYFTGYITSFRNYNRNIKILWRENDN